MGAIINGVYMHFHQEIHCSYEIIETPKTFLGIPIGGTKICWKIYMKNELHRVRHFFFRDNPNYEEKIKLPEHIFHYPTLEEIEISEIGKNRKVVVEVRANWQGYEPAGYILKVLYLA